MVVRELDPGFTRPPADTTHLADFGKVSALRSKWKAGAVCPLCLTFPRAVTQVLLMNLLWMTDRSQRGAQFSGTVSGNGARALGSSHREAVAWHG